MQISFEVIPFVHSRRLAAAALAALGVACTSAPHASDADRDVAQALELENAIAFHWEGAPLDERVEHDGALPAAVAIRRAVETSAELQAALARVRAAEAEADQASLLPNPILSFVLRFPEGGGKPEIEASIAAELLGILQRPNRARAAEHRLESDAARALSVALDVVADVERRYADVQALEALAPALEAHLAVLARLRDVAQARLDLGEGTRGDVRSLEAEASGLAAEIAARKSALRGARVALARAIGEPSSAADWTLDAWSAPPPATSSESAWIEAALAARPEILAIEWELRAREIEADAARSAMLGNASAGVDAERDGDWSVGPSLTAPLPIFDTGRSRAARARALTAEERHRLTAARRTVVEEVRSALAARLAAQDALDRVAHELIPLQERRRADVEEAYRLGLADATSMLLAERELREADARRIELARELSVAHGRLQRAVGGARALRTGVLAAAEGGRP